MPRYRIVHTTRYDFERPITGCDLEARLVPRSLTGQRVERWQLAVNPRPASSSTARDEHGNTVSRLRVAASFDRLTITSAGAVSRAGPTTPPLPVIPWQTVAHRLRREAGTTEAGAFVASSSLVRIDPDLMAYAAPSFPAGRPLLDAASDLVSRIRRDIAYERAATTVTTPASEALRLRRGVCQDLAHVAIGCLRARGLAARYVGGYLAGAGGAPSEGRAHAWTSVWIPEWGWVDLDPTLGRFAGPAHVTVAWGRDYDDVSPLRGTFEGDAAHRIEVRVEVSPDDADPESGAAGANEERARRPRR